MAHLAYFHVALSWQNVLHKPTDYSAFFQSYRRYLNPLVQIFAYCLTPGGFNMLVSPFANTPTPPPKTWLTGVEDLVAAVAEYRSRIYPHKADFSLGEPKYHDLVEMGSLVNEVATIHLIPVRAGLCRTPEAWRYCSYSMLLGDSKTPLQRDTVFSWFGGREAFLTFHANQLQTLLRGKR